MFCQYVLRTTNVDAARAFYTAILGENLWSPEVSIAALPEQAIARGARPHWLGHIGIHDVEQTIERVIAEGGQPLGPRQEVDGAPMAVLRDPFGAIFALRSKASGGSASPMAMHVLHCRDHERAFAMYASLFNWVPKGVFDLGEHGIHQRFAWNESGPSIGSIANTARASHVHPHWLHFFRVDDLESVVAKVRALSGAALPVTRTAEDDLVVACDDPEGAAFGLYQFAR